VVGNITKYTFTKLKKDVTYFFSVTAYDTSGNESEYSDEATMTQYGLTVIKSGTGSGDVTSSPAGITCGTDCAGRYKSGSVVTLTARPKKDSSTFTGWSGGKCSGNGNCVLTITSPTTITAIFSDPTSCTKTIIDNRDQATSKTGTWEVSSAPLPYGDDSVWGRDGAIFRWHFAPCKSGLYNVSLWWTAYTSRSARVPVDIESLDGNARVYVNQQKNGGQWNKVGQFYFKKGSVYTVSVTAQPAPVSTCADAVKFKLVP
jgi:hypothetical protein